jgi:hypothetical protein
MFVRFRETGCRLQVSLVETRRINGKVRHEHIASFGSVRLPMTVPDRIQFWIRLHERLAKLSNRIDATLQGKILGHLHARIPMVTADEQRALQLDNAKDDARLWSAMQDLHAAQVEGHKDLVATAERVIADNQAAAAKAGERTQAASERIARIERGEDVSGGLDRPKTPAEFDAQLIAAGFTRADLRHMSTLAELPEEALDTIIEASLKASDRTTRSTARALLVKVRRRFQPRFPNDP